MAYYKGKDIEKARGNAIKEIILEQRSIAQVARRFGKARSTIYRWLKKWQVQQTVELHNYGRPNRKLGKVFRWQSVVWDIKTLNSAPKAHPNALDAVTVQAIIQIRKQKYECAEIIHYKLTKHGINVSLSSIKRTIKRHELWRRTRPYHRNAKRPLVSAPGELVQVDTVHYVNPLNGSRIYITTIIDLYTRMAYAKAAPSLSQSNTARAILEAQHYMGFTFKMVQSDNGAEFQKYFQDRLHSNGIATRHTRVRHPNDNAHIERFNRTLRKECIGQYNPNKNIKFIEGKLIRFIHYYNYDRIHLGISLKTPYEVLQRC